MYLCNSLLLGIDITFHLPQTWIVGLLQLIKENQLHPPSPPPSQRKSKEKSTNKEAYNGLCCKQSIISVVELRGYSNRGVKRSASLLYFNFSVRFLDCALVVVFAKLRL